MLPYTTPPLTVDRKRGSRAILRCWINFEWTVCLLRRPKWDMNILKKVRAPTLFLLKYFILTRFFLKKAVVPLTFTEKIDFSISTWNFAQRNFPTRVVYCENTRFSGCFYPKIRRWKNTRLHIIYRPKY